MITPARMIADPALLGPWFAGPSWDAWRVVLKGAFCEPMTAGERARFCELAEREPPKKRVRECYFAIGRRGGKDSIASAIASYAAVFGDFARYLRPGEKAVILCLACDRVQARNVFSYIRGYFEQCQLLSPLATRITDDSIELRNGVDIVVATSNFRSLRGRTVAVCIMNELAYYRDDSGRYANPDIEIYTALVPALATLRKAGAMIVGISSVYRRAGLLFEKWRTHHGQDGDVLVIRAPSISFNPLLDQAEIDAEIARDPERGKAEWLSEWRSDIADFVAREVVEAAIIPDFYELPCSDKHHYIGFADPSGGSSELDDARYCAAEGERGILDAIREVRPPFSPESVVEDFAAILKSYQITRVTGDRYAGEWPREQFAKRGITYEPSKNQKATYTVSYCRC